MFGTRRTFAGATLPEYENQILGQKARIRKSDSGVSRPHCPTRLRAPESDFPDLENATLISNKNNKERKARP
jgi:hypothetical protein